MLGSLESKNYRDAPGVLQKLTHLWIMDPQNMFKRTKSWGYAPGNTAAGSAPTKTAGRSCGAGGSCGSVALIASWLRMRATLHRSEGSVKQQAGSQYAPSIARNHQGASERRHHGGGITDKAQGRSLYGVSERRHHVWTCCCKSRSPGNSIGAL